MGKKHCYNNGVVVKIFEETDVPEGWVPGRIERTKISELNIEEVVEFYHTHTEAQVCEKFNIHKKILKRVCNLAGYKKSQQEISISRNQHNLERFGCINVFQLPEVIQKAKDTKIEAHGSLEQAYKVRNDKTIMTLQRQTGDPTITNVFQRKATKQRIKETLAARYNGDITAAYRESGLRASDTKERKYGYRGVLQTPEVIRKKRSKYLYNGLSFDSSWELAFYIWATDHGKEIIRLPVALAYQVDDKQYHYYPDFCCDGELIELKGKYLCKDGCKDSGLCDFFNTNNQKALDAKYNCMLENNVIVISDDEIQPYLQYINETYGRDYLHTFKSYNSKNKDL